MPLRTCTHIKTNGSKCGSPALRHHTLCYFHYQWQRRDQRRIRLGGPIGIGKNSGIELPLLDGPEAILLSIMEIQNAILDQRIPLKTATALLYSLQLALQARIPYSGLCGREPVRECPELELELEMERAKSLRPAKQKCASCSKQEMCLSPRNCRKLPKLPSGYRREGDHLVRDPEAASPQPCHPERSTPASETRTCVAEGPFVSPLDVPTIDTFATPETTTDLLRECSPGRESGVTGHKFPPSRAQARRQIVPLEDKQTVLRLRDSRRFAQDDTSKTDAIACSDHILRFKTNALIDLPGKFPQLAETTREGK